MSSANRPMAWTELTEDQNRKLDLFARENGMTHTEVLGAALDAYLDSSRAMGDADLLTGENTAQFSIDVHPPLCTIRTIGHEFTVPQETAKRLIGKRIEIAVYVERGGDDD